MLIIFFVFLYIGVCVGLCLCLCMCVSHVIVCVCVFVYVCVYTHMYTLIYIYTYIIHIYVCFCVCVQYIYWNYPGCQTIWWRQTSAFGACHVTALEGVKFPQFQTHTNTHMHTPGIYTCIYRYVNVYVTDQNKTDELNLSISKKNRRIFHNFLQEPMRYRVARTHRMPSLYRSFRERAL